MGFTEILARARERKRAKKELISSMDERLRAEEILMERRKSSNERELEKFMDEEREENIKVKLEDMRRRRKDDISFNHNPLFVKNITSKTDWEVLKEKNLFKGKGSSILNQGFIHKNSSKLLKNEKWLFK